VPISCSNTFTPSGTFPDVHSHFLNPRLGTPSCIELNVVRKAPSGIKSCLCFLQTFFLFLFTPHDGKKRFVSRYCLFRGTTRLNLRRSFLLCAIQERFYCFGPLKKSLQSASQQRPTFACFYFTFLVASWRIEEWNL